MSEGTPPLVAGFDAVLSDLDGVVYAGPAVVDGAAESLRRLASEGTSLAYITNNASRSSEQVAEHLRSLGMPATAEQVFGAARIGAEILAQHVPAGARVLITGSRELEDQVRAQGLTPVHSAEDHPDAVIQGFDPGLGWADLAEASYAVAAGAFWLATNADLTFPRDRGLAPGIGSLIYAVTAATGRTPMVTGKPEPHLFTTAAQHLGASRPLVVGDRLDTDIRGGNAAGMGTAAVLTGVDTVETILAAALADRPTYLLQDLRGLHEPYPSVTEADGVFTCGRSRARVEPAEDGGVLFADGPRSLDYWRAACAAWWAFRPDAQEALAPAIKDGW